MAPANAIGTPIRAGKLYPNPIATGIPPRKAPAQTPFLHILHRQSLVSDIEFLEFSCSLEEMLGFIF